MAVTCVMLAWVSHGLFYTGSYMWCAGEMRIILHYLLQIVCPILTLLCHELCYKNVKNQRNSKFVVFCADTVQTHTM